MCPVEIGRWAKPHIARTYGINPGMIRTTMSAEDMQPKGSEPMIESYETVYDYPWEKIKPQLIKWMDEGIISPDCKFYAWGSTKYSVFNWEDFINLPFEDLELLGKAGKRFDGIYSSGDANSIATIRKIVRSELEKNIKI